VRAFSPAQMSCVALWPTSLRIHGPASVSVDQKQTVYRSVGRAVSVEKKRRPYAMMVFVNTMRNIPQPVVLPPTGRHACADSPHGVELAAVANPVIRGPYVQRARLLFVRPL
jgi:hypothetical protein